MFNAIRNAFGLAYVKEEDGVITIGGINSENVLADINKIWGNTRVVKLMFIEVNKYDISFYSFYGVVQIMEYKKRTSSRFRIKNVVDEMKEVTWLKRMDIEYPPILQMKELSKLKYTLRPHQLEFLETYDKKTQKMGLDGFLLAAAPGAGKTLMGLALSATLKAEVSILLAPKSILDNVWTDGVIEQFAGETSYWVSTGDKPLKAGYKYYIVHFDALVKLIPLISSFKSKRSVVVLDESHNFNDSKSQRSRMFVDFCHKIKCKHVVLSSGTPIKMLGFEMITLLQCIDPLFTPEVEEIFRKIFGASSKRAVDILRHRIDLIGHKIPREQFMSIAEPIVQQLRVKLPNGGGKKYTIATIKLEMKAFIKSRSEYYRANMKKYVDEYEECLKIYAKTMKTSKEKDTFRQYVENIDEIKAGYDPKAHVEIAKYCTNFEKKVIAPSLDSNHKKIFKNAVSVIKYVNLKVLGAALGQILGKRRAECHCEMIPHSGLIDIVLGADKKTLCFSSSVSVIETAEKYFKEKGLKPTVVHGSVDRTTDVIIKEFKSDPTINPILATLQSMSAGVTLTNCSVCVFIDLPWRSYLSEQGSARIFRIGQDTQ